MPLNLNVIRAFLFGLLLTTGCRTSQLATNNHLILIDATKESWVPGIVRNNDTKAGGTQYTLLVELKSEELKIDKLIIDSQELSVEIQHTDSIGQIIEITGRTNIQETQKDADIKATSIINEKELEGLLQYSYKNNQYFLPVKSFTRKSSKPLPR